MPDLRKRIKSILQSIRESIGLMECKVDGRCISHADCFDGNHFYSCIRCGRDYMTGLTLKQWIKEELPHCDYDDQPDYN